MTAAETAPAPRRRRAELVARRVRGLMGEQRISGVQMAQNLRLSQAAFSRRSVGDLAFSLDEIESLAEILDADEAYLLGFTDVRSELPRLDSNQRPFVSQFPQVNGLPQTSTPQMIPPGLATTTAAVGGAVVVDLATYRSGRSAGARTQTSRRPA